MQIHPSVYENVIMFQADKGDIFTIDVTCPFINYLIKVSVFMVTTSGALVIKKENIISITLYSAEKGSRAGKKADFIFAEYPYKVVTEKVIEDECVRGAGPEGPTDKPDNIDARVPEKIS